MAHPSMPGFNHTRTEKQLKKLDDRSLLKPLKAATGIWPPLPAWVSGLGPTATATFQRHATNSQPAETGWSRPRGRPECGKTKVFRRFSPTRACSTRGYISPIPAARHGRATHVAAGELGVNASVTMHGGLALVRRHTRPRRTSVRRMPIDRCDTLRMITRAHISHDAPPITATHVPRRNLYSNGPLTEHGRGRHRISHGEACTQETALSPRSNPGPRTVAAPTRRAASNAPDKSRSWSARPNPLSGIRLARPLSPG